MKKIFLLASLVLVFNFIKPSELPMLEGSAVGFSSSQPTPVSLQLHCGTTTPLQGIAIGTINNPNNTLPMTSNIVGNIGYLGAPSNVCTVYLVPGNSMRKPIIYRR